MMFRSEALRTRYIIRSGTLRVELEAFDSEARWLVASLVRLESFELEAPSGVALPTRLEAFDVKAPVRRSLDRTVGIIARSARDSRKR